MFDGRKHLSLSKKNIYQKRTLFTFEMNKQFFPSQQYVNELNRSKEKIFNEYVFHVPLMLPGRGSLWVENGTNMNSDNP